MDALQHEDHQGLWEVVWALNAQAPEASRTEKVALARIVVMGLLAAREIELWRISWPELSGRELTEQELARLPLEDASWFDPENTELLVQIRLHGRARP